MKNNKLILIFVVTTISIIIFALSALPKTSERSDLDSFTKCIVDSGAKFYGTFWCTHCQAQKQKFGTSKKLLPYIECSTSDGNGQTQLCKDKNIEGYPTWEFADGTRISGEVELSKLAEVTSCKLPN